MELHVGLDFVRLPFPALSLILFWMDVPTAFSVARKNRRLFAAFYDETCWKRRCDTLEIEHASNDEFSWMSLFRDNRPWRIHVHTLVGRRRLSVDHSFTIDCTPSTTVDEFLRLVSVHKGNVSAHWSRWGSPYDPKLVPFDESATQVEEEMIENVPPIFGDVFDEIVIENHARVEDDGCDCVQFGESGIRKEEETIANKLQVVRDVFDGDIVEDPAHAEDHSADNESILLPTSLINCVFNDKERSATIQAAGLCQDAVLQQFHRNYVD